jgi:hypothetical protein
MSAKQKKVLSENTARAMGDAPKEIKELIEMTSEGVNMRQLYDFQARRIYNVDLNVNRCTTQEYASAYAPVWHDPIGGAAEIVQGTGSLPTIRRENVNGIAARLVEAALEGAQGKYRYWLDEKFGFPVKQTIVIGSAPEKALFEMRQISYAPPATTLFTAPAPCTRVAGVVNASGGSSETTADVTVQGETRLGGAATAQGESGRAGASARKQPALAGGAVMLGKWDFTGKDAAGTQWSGTLTVEKLEPNSFDPTTHTNVSACRRPLDATPALLSGSLSRSRGRSLRRLLRHRFLGGGLLLLRLGRSHRLPPLLRGGDDCGPPSTTQLPLGLGCCAWPWLSRFLGFCPSLSLCFSNRFPASGTHLPALPCRRFRRGGGFGGATGERRPELANLLVYPSFLPFVAIDGGGDQFGCQPWCRHLMRSLLERAYMMPQICSGS